MRKEKPLLLDEIKQKIDGSSAMIVTCYGRLEPNTSWRLRDALLKKSSMFEVVKKRVFLKAATLAGMPVDESLLKGHIGVVFVGASDVMAVNKAVFEFAESNGQVLEVLCGRMDGKIVPGVELAMLSKLPAIDEMRATMLALFTAPMSQMLSVVEAKINADSSDLEQKS